MEQAPHPDHTPSGYPERQHHALDSVEQAAEPLMEGPLVDEGAQMADVADRESTRVMDAAERERKLAEIAARNAVILKREHEIRMKYLVSASRSDQIRRSA